MDITWPVGAAALEGEQRRLAALTPAGWRPDDPASVLAAGCFVAFVRGEQGPGRPGDRCWGGAALVRRGLLVAAVAVPGVAGASYVPGLLALREGPALEAAVRALPVRADVLLVDATGRDHPRRCGLAVHLGAVLGVPTVGVTHRPLRAEGPFPADRRGATAPLVLDGEEVGRWVCTRRGVRPVAVHAAWRTDVTTAVEVVLAVATGARTPEPLRQARVAARTARSSAGGGGRLRAAGPGATPP